MSNTAEQYPDFSGLTFEKVWAMFQESHKEFEEYRKESRRVYEESRKEYEEFREAMREQSKETDKKLQEASQIVAETSKSIDRLEKSMESSNKKIGNLDNRFGEVVEHLITPGLIPRFNELGFHFTRCFTREEILHPRTHETLTEMDIRLENRDSIIIVEVKARPTLSDITKHIWRLQLYREQRDESPQKDSRKIFGAIAAAVFPKDVQKAALQAGFYVIIQGGDTITIDVPDGFEPTAF